MNSTDADQASRAHPHTVAADASPQSPEGRHEKGENLLLRGFERYLSTTDDDDDRTAFKLEKVLENSNADQKTPNSDGGEADLTLEQLWFGNLTEREQRIL
jgi:hypothetical protein